LSKIVSADLETYLKDNEMIVYLVSLAKSVKSKYFFSKDPRALFATFFSNLFSTENRHHQIYFHDLSGVDGFFLIKQLLNFDYKISPLIHDGKLLQLKVSKGKNRNDIYVIKDSKLLLLTSLAELGVKLGICLQSRGIFPYLLKDLDYIGSFPDYKYFDKTKVSPQEINIQKKELNLKTKSGILRKKVLKIV
jgi:hypothetical protein